MAKIIVITSNIAPYRLRWCEELSKFFDVEIVYTKDHDYERDDRWLQRSSDKCRLKKLNNPRDLYDPLCFDVIDIIKENKDALLIFDGYGPKTNLLGLLYCRIKGVNSLVNVDGYPTERKKNQIKELIKRLVIGKLCTYFTCSGEATKRHLVAYGADKDRIVIHNLSSVSEKEIIDKPLTLKEKLKLRKKLGIETDRKIVLGVGRFLPLKRFEDLIMAVRKCQNDCELYILGGEPSETYLKLAEGCDRIHFIDFVLPEEVNDYYKASNLFVLPSETDVWGLVLNEAMAQGLPVIASDSVVASHSLILDNGYIFRTYDVEELARDIDLCMIDESNHKMAENSLKIIKDFTIENMVRLQMPMIEKLFEINKNIQSNR